MKRSSLELVLLLAAMGVSPVLLSGATPAERPAAKQGPTLADVAQAYADVRMPLPIAEHPRLYFRAQDIAALKEKLRHPEMRAVREKIQTLSERERPPGSAYDEAYEAATRANALLYALHGTRENGERAVARVLAAMVKTAPAVPSETAASAKATSAKSGGTTKRKSVQATTVARLFQGRNAGNEIVTIAMVYDWCYGLMADAQRRECIERIELLAKNLEVSYPPVKQGALVGHGPEWQLQRDLLAAAVAVHDEHPLMFKVVGGRFFKEFVPGRNIFYRSMAHHQGDNYGLVRFQQELWAALTFDRMGLGNPFLPEQRFIPYQWIYTRRPDGQLVRDGDTMQDKQPVGEYWTREHYALMYLMAAGYFRDPYFKDQFLRIARPEDFPIEAALFYEPAMPAKPPTELPLTRYFPEPRGALVARTGWEPENVNLGSPVAMAELKIKTIQFNNHQALDAGTFTLYYKGGLATKSGAYRGKTSGYYFSDHDLNFNKRTIAHNGILVYDPEENSWGQPTGEGVQPINDGGQRWPDNRGQPPTVEHLLQNNYEVGKVLSWQFGPDARVPDYTYIKGDITKAYSDKMAQCLRSFVFLNLKNGRHPAALIVFDRVSARRPELKKYWLLQSVEEPRIDGSRSILTRANHGYNGRLVNETLLPAGENLAVEKIGGPGREHWVFGKNFLEEPYSADSSTESNGWRLQFSPVKPAETDHFLNVMHVMDSAGGLAPLNAVKLESETMVGAAIADRVVFFSKSGERLTEPVSIASAGSSPRLKHLILDLAAGVWSVTRRGGATQELVATPEGGSIYFEGPPAEYALRRVR